MLNRAAPNATRIKETRGYAGRAKDLSAGLQINSKVPKRSCCSEFERCCDAAMLALPCT